MSSWKPKKKASGKPKKKASGKPWKPGGPSQPKSYAKYLMEAKASPGPSWAPLTPAAAAWKEMAEWSSNQMGNYVYKTLASFVVDKPLYHAVLYGDYGQSVPTPAKASSRTPRPARIPWEG